MTLRIPKQGARLAIISSPLITLLQAPNRHALDALLADGVCFHSPVADYVGRADVAHLLWLIAMIMHDLRPTRELGDRAAKTTFVSAVIEGRPLQGVLDECYDENGLLIDATLMLRPFATLRIAIAAMAAALETAPMPSLG